MWPVTSKEGGFQKRHNALHGGREVKNWMKKRHEICERSQKHTLFEPISFIPGLTYDDSASFWCKQMVLFLLS